MLTAPHRAAIVFTLLAGLWLLPAASPAQTAPGPAPDQKSESAGPPPAAAPAEGAATKPANPAKLAYAGADAGPSYETVVTANRRKSSLRSAPAMVTVIPGEALRSAPEKTIDTFLRRVPSVSFSRQHVAECGPGRDVTLRGIHDQKRTLVLVDGIPVNDGVTGAVNWSLIPPEAVDRIEVVRGPMSALYGSGAMGGVIHIITRTPERQNETTVKGSYGALNTASATLLQGGGFEGGGYLVGGHIYRTDGYVQAADPKAYHTENARTDLSLLAKGVLRPDDRTSLVLGVHHVNESYSRGIITDNQNNASTLVRLSLDRHTRGGANIAAAAYAQVMARKVDLGARPTYAVHDHTEFDDVIRLGQLFQADFRVARINTVTVGVDTSYTMMDRHNVYDLTARAASAGGDQLLASLFAQDEVRLFFGEHRLYITPGLRVDVSLSHNGHALDTAPGPNAPVDETYADRSWVAANPKLGVVYRYAGMTTVRASAGRSFAAPTLFELYTVFTRGPLLLYGNPELDPESAWSAELGLDQRIVGGLLGRLTGWYTRGQDFIGYRSVGQNQLRVDNITEVQVLGLDTELRYDIGPMWTLFGGYTLSHATVLTDEAAAALEGNDLPFVPRHRARLGVVFRYRKWVMVDLGARYEGARYTDMENTEATRLDHHVLLDLGISGALLGHITWALTLQNILDQRYDVYSVPTEASEAPGILAAGSLAFTF